MMTWIALLRGVNVGGRNKLPMQALRTLLEAHGLRNVRTYIQSGNVVFESNESNSEALVTLISGCIDVEFGFRPPIIVVTRDSLTAAIDGCPYLEGVENPKVAHLFFLSTPVLEADLGPLESVRRPSERFALVGQVFYLLTPDGFNLSKVATKVERVLNVPMTARNLRSVLMIAELSKP